MNKYLQEGFNPHLRNTSNTDQAETLSSLQVVSGRVRVFRELSCLHETRQPEAVREQSRGLRWSPIKRWMQQQLENRARTRC